MESREPIAQRVIDWSKELTNNPVSAPYQFFRLGTTVVQLLLDIRDELAELNNRAKEQKREMERLTREEKKRR